jgi:hypothetical protein
MPNPLAKKETIALFFFMFIEEEGALLLGKTIQKYSHQLINPASLEDILEINFDLWSLRSFLGQYLAEALFLFIICLI